MGLDPCNVGPISLHTVLRLRDLEIPLEAAPRRPLAARLQDFEAADHIVAIKGAEHRPMIEQSFAAWLPRVEFWEVHDLDCAGPEDAMPCLEREVTGLIARLLETKEPE